MDSSANISAIIAIQEQHEMNRSLGPAAFICVNLLSLPAWSLDCAGARQPVDQLICGNASLRKADADMSNAYFGLLKGVRDPDIHQALISSQQRWIKARYLEGERWINDGDERHAEIMQLQAVIASRTEKLSTRNGVTETSELVANVKAEQGYASRFSGGPYSGYWSECDFFPTGNGGSTYACFGMWAIQSGSRVCSDYTYWASGRIYEYQKVANISEKQLVTAAACGEDNAVCPTLHYQPTSSEKGEYGWNFHADDRDDDYNPDLSRLPVLKFDPDFEAGGRNPGYVPGWMTQCLTDSDFPSRSIESPDTAK